MFTEEEVATLRRLSEVELLSIVAWLVSKMLLQSELDPADIKAHYNSYCAAGVISVYNPISIMSAFKRSRIENSWVATSFLLVVVFNFSFSDQLSIFCYRQIPSLRQG